MRSSREQLRSLWRSLTTTDYRLWLIFAAFFTWGTIEQSYRFYTQGSSGAMTRGELVRSVVAGSIALLVCVFFAVRQYPVTRAIGRIKRGQCTVCGYDLRGSTQSDTCPEYGEPIVCRLPAWYIERMRRQAIGPTMPDWWLKPK